MTDIDRDLRELRQSAPPLERLDAVRARVRERIAARERLRWGGLLVGSTAAMFLFFALWKAQAPPTQMLEFVGNPPAAPEAAFHIPPREEPKPRRAPRASAPPREIRVAAWTEPTLEHSGSTLLELPSTDDNVVLYFLIDPQGD